MYACAEESELQILRMQAIFNAMAVSGKDPIELLKGEKGKIAGVIKKTSTPTSEFQGEQPQIFPAFEHPDKYKNMSSEERKRLSDDMIRVHKKHSGTKLIKAEEE